MLNNLAFSQKQLLAEKIQEQVAHGAMCRDPDDIAEDLEDLLQHQEVIQILEFLMDLDNLNEWITEALGELHEPEEL